MTYAIKILEKDINEWRRQYVIDKDYYKGNETCQEAIEDFANSKNHIAELEKAIRVLKISSNNMLADSACDSDCEFHKTTLVNGGICCKTWREKTEASISR